MSDISEPTEATEPTKTTTEIQSNNESPKTSTKTGSSVISILQQLGDNELCVIPKDALLMILQDNATYQQKANEINENIANSLRILTQKNTPYFNSESENTSANIVSKLDELIIAISRNNCCIAEQQEEPYVIENELKERYHLMEQAVHYEKVSTYYRELLYDEIPYAPRKFRVKVNKSTPEMELKHRRSQTIDAVNTEINIMEERVTLLREQIKKLDDQVADFLTKNEEKRLGIMEMIQTDEKQIVENFENNYLSKRRNAYRRCKQNTSEYMLTFVDDKTNDLPEKWWHPNYKDRNRPEKEFQSGILNQ